MLTVGVLSGDRGQEGSPGCQERIVRQELAVRQTLL